MRLVTQSGKMEYYKSKYAGGDLRNRKFIDYKIFPAGKYQLHYKSNRSHAAGDWKGTAPENEFYYGITVFNIHTIQRIKQNWHEAGLTDE